MSESSITIRRSSEVDRPALARLALLDSQEPPAGDALLAYVGDEPAGEGAQREPGVGEVGRRAAGAEAARGVAAALGALRQHTVDAADQEPRRELPQHDRTERDAGDRDQARALVADAGDERDQIAVDRLVALLGDPR